MSEKIQFDESRFQELISNRNYLGSWMLLKESGLERTEEAIQTGVLASDLINAIAESRSPELREKQMYYRSLLSYILKDWPGLASLYREQTRPLLGGMSAGLVPDHLSDLWQDFSDVMSGRKNLDESFRQRMAETQNKAREFGVNLDPLQEFAKDAERELRRGVDEVRDYLKNIFQDNSAGKSASASPAESSKTATEEPDATSGIKVKIQDADDPLPGSIHQAPPAERDK